MNMAAHANLLPDSGKRRPSLMANLAFGLVVAAAAGGAWLSINSYLDQNKLLREQEQVQTLDPATAASLSTEDRLSRIEQMKARFASNPLDNDALTSLSLLFAAAGDQAKADQMALAAARLTMRNETAQLLALDTKMKQGDFASALASIDGLIRSSPDLSQGLFDQILAMARNADTAPKLVALLSQNPPWRLAFFTRANAAGTETFLIYSLLTALRSTEAPPSDAELRILLGRMIKDKDYAGASYLWLDMLSEVDLKRTGSVFDPGFDAQPRNLYFDWTIGRSKTVEVKTVPRATGSADRVLQVDYIANRESIATALQYLRLDAGEYVFSGEQKSDSLKSDSGIAWRMQCIEGSTAALVQAPKLEGSTPWTRFDVRFTVPEGCTTQILVLSAAGNAKLDQNISGAATFDNITVRSVTAE